MNAIKSIQAIPQSSTHAQHFVFRNACPRSRCRRSLWTMRGRQTGRRQRQLVPSLVQPIERPEATPLHQPAALLRGPNATQSRTALLEDRFFQEARGGAGTTLPAQALGRRTRTCRIIALSAKTSRARSPLSAGSYLQSNARKTTGRYSAKAQSKGFWKPISA